MDKPNRTTEKKPSLALEVGALAVRSAVEEIPYVGGLISGGWRLHRDRVIRAAQQRNAETLDTFYREMAEGLPDPDIEVIQALIDDRDFHSLLRACVAEIEEEKIEAYAALAQKIAGNAVDREVVRHFTISLKEMTMRELDLLRHAYIAKRFDLVPKTGNSGSSVTQEELLRPGQPGNLQTITIEKLTAKGFLYKVELSYTGENFVESCTKSINLTPQAFGYKTWSGQNVAIISYDLADNRIVKQSAEIESCLRKYQIRAQTVAVTRSTLQQVRMKSTAGLLLLGEDSPGLQENWQFLAEYSDKIPLVVIKMSEKCPALLSEIRVAKLIEYDADFKSLVSQMTSSILDFRNLPGSK